MWQFAEAVRGLADGCMELGVPVTGGNVSLYNQTGGKAINPTPVVAMMGVMDDVTRRTPRVGPRNTTVRPSTCWVPRVTSWTVQNGRVSRATWGSAPEG